MDLASKRQDMFSVLGEMGECPCGQVFCLIFVIRSSDGLASVAFGKPAPLGKKKKEGKKRKKGRKEGRKEDHICSVCQFPQYKYSHYG